MLPFDKMIKYHRVIMTWVFFVSQPLNFFNKIAQHLRKNGANERKNILSSSYVHCAADYEIKWVVFTKFGTSILLSKLLLRCLKLNKQLTETSL